MARDVVIVGAGLAGLTCAVDLQAAGVDCVVLEAADAIGGRVRTDHVDGYTLDRGFQVLLTAYPEVRKRLDLDALAPGAFDPGARVNRDGRLVLVADPLRRPATLATTLSSGLFGPLDLLRVARLVADVRIGAAHRLVDRPDRSTARRLTEAGFSGQAIRRFWQPLFAGIQLDPALEVSSRRFDLVLRMLASGASVLPRDGMGAVASQLASSLSPGTVQLDTPVSAIVDRRVERADGSSIECAAVVVATDGPAAHRLLGGAIAPVVSRPVACVWVVLEGAPFDGAYLILDGEGGPAGTVAPVSAAQPSYAPEGKSLLAVAVVGPRALEGGIERAVTAQLARLFDVPTTSLEVLRTDVIEHGQPDQPPPLTMAKRVDLGEGRYVCGDHRDTASIQGAMFSGGRTARAVLAGLRDGATD